MRWAFYRQSVERLTAEIGVHPSDIITFLNLKGLVLMGMDHPAVFDKKDILLKRLLYYGLVNGLVLLGLTDDLDNLDELGPFLEFSFFAVNGRFQ